MFTLTTKTATYDFPSLDIGGMLIERDDLSGIINSHINTFKNLPIGTNTAVFSHNIISPEKSQAKPAHRGDRIIYYTHFICIKPKGYVLFIKYNLDNEWYVSLTAEMIIVAECDIDFDTPSL
jgi:hypothetical protein